MYLKQILIIAFTLVFYELRANIPWITITGIHKMELGIGQDQNATLELENGDYIGAFTTTDSGWICIGQGEVTNGFANFLINSNTQASFEIKYKIRKVDEECDREIFLTYSQQNNSPYIFAPGSSTTAYVKNEIDNSINLTTDYATCQVDTLQLQTANPWVYFFSEELEIDSSSSVEISEDLSPGDYTISALGNNICGIEIIDINLTVETCEDNSTENNQIDDDTSDDVNTNNTNNSVSETELSSAYGSAVTTIIIQTEENFKIYNANGSLVFEGNGTTEWDGTDSSDMLLPAGAYYIIFSDDSFEQITIIK